MEDLKLHNLAGSGFHGSCVAREVGGSVDFARISDYVADVVLDTEWAFVDKVFSYHVDFRRIGGAVAEVDLDLGIWLVLKGDGDPVVHKEGGHRLVSIEHIVSCYDCCKRKK